MQLLNCTVDGYLKSIAYIRIIEYKIAEQNLNLHWGNNKKILYFMDLKFRVVYSINMYSIGAAASVPRSFLLALLGNDNMYSKITESFPHSWAIQHLVFSMFKVKSDVLWF